MKWMKSLAGILVIIFTLVIFDYFSTNLTADTAVNNTTTVEDVIFPHNKVIDVNIEIDEDLYSEMNTNAMSEEVVMANITYNGYTFNSIGIRPKGNSSLRDVAQSDSDRFSFKVDFNYYLEDQDFYGITKINLNNIFSDPSMMAEYLGYEMLDELDAVSSRTTYVALSINDEYFGLYLSVEQVNNSFLKDHYGDASGELYKPDMGVGSDLAYISDDGTAYSGVFPENMESSDNKELTTLIKTLEDGGNLDDILNVDSFLKYLALSTMTVHLDSYQGGMYHNYYLYNNNGIFEWISWDLNMIFNGFPQSGLSDAEAVEFLIDEPVKGAIEKYPLIQAIFKNEAYVEQYHKYLEILSAGYLSGDTINQKVLSTYEMIKDYVEIDPTAFYTYEEFETALFVDEGENISLLNFIEQRVTNVSKQLSKEIPSTNNGEGNTGTDGKGGENMRPGNNQEDNLGNPPPDGKGPPPEMREDGPRDMQNQIPKDTMETSQYSSKTNIILLITIAILMFIVSIRLSRKK